LEEDRARILEITKKNLADPLQGKPKGKGGLGMNTLVLSPFGAELAALFGEGL